MNLRVGTLQSVIRLIPPQRGGWHAAKFPTVQRSLDSRVVAGFHVRRRFCAKFDFLRAIRESPLQACVNASFCTVRTALVTVRFAESLTAQNDRIFEIVKK